jgi:multisubunit Na+/H+ antiporter MnhB subunit
LQGLAELAFNTTLLSFREKEISMINRLVKTAFFSGVPFGLCMGLFFAWIYKSYIAFPAGLACGLAFGFIVAIFTETQRKRMESKDGWLDGEPIIFQGPVNHFFNGEGRGA